MRSIRSRTTSCVTVSPMAICRSPCSMSSRTATFSRNASISTSPPKESSTACTFCFSITVTLFEFPARAGPWTPRRRKDRSANGTSASVGRAGRIMRSNRRSWSGWMRPDRGGAGPSAPWHGMPAEAVDVDVGQLVYPSPERLPGRKWTCTSSPQSVGGPRAGETGGGSSGSPRCGRIFRIGPGSVMNAMSRMSPPHPRALERKLLPRPGHEFGLWRRAVSWEGGLSRKSQQSPVVSPNAACPPTASGRVDFRPRPGPIQLDALCRGST